MRDREQDQSPPAGARADPRGRGQGGRCRPLHCPEMGDRHDQEHGPGQDRRPGGDPADQPGGAGAGCRIHPVGRRRASGSSPPESAAGPPVRPHPEDVVQ